MSHKHGRGLVLARLPGQAIEVVRTRESLTITVDRITPSGISLRFVGSRSFAVRPPAEPVLDRALNESVEVEHAGELLVITVDRITPGEVRLRFVGSRSFDIWRDDAGPPRVTTATLVELAVEHGLDWSPDDA